MATAEARQRYREKHPERDKQARKEAKARYIARHPDRYAATNRKRAANYRAKNPEKVKATLRQWYKENSQKVLDQRLLDLYGLTRDEWNGVLVDQGFCCAICGTDAPGKKGWQTDHDHGTNAFRGILCTQCNPGLGLFRDDPELLRRAADYLETHAEEV